MTASGALELLGARLPDVVFAAAFSVSFAVLLVVSLRYGGVSLWSAGAFVAISLLIAFMGRLSFIRRRALAESRAALARAMEEMRGQRGE